MDTRKIDNEIKMQQWMERIRECRSSWQPVRSGVWNMMSMKKDNTIG